MKFLRDFSITGINTLIITLLAFINNVIITRQIGVEGRGKYAVVSNSIILLVLLLGEGIRQSNTIIAGENKGAVKYLLNQTFFLLLIIIIILLIIFNLDNLWSHLLPNISKELFFLTLSITLFTILWQSLRSIFLGLKNIVAYNIIQLVSPFITLLINLIGIYFFNFGLVEILISLLVGTLISSGYGVFLAYSKLKSEPTSNLTKKSSKIIAKSTLSAIQFFILSRGNIFLINYLIGPINAGLFSVGLIFSDMILKIPSVAGPLLISKSLNEDPKKTPINTARLVRVILCFNVIVIIVLAMAGKVLIVVLFGNDFIGSYSVLIYLFPAILFFGPGAIIYSYFISKSYPIPILIINGLLAITNIVFNIWLIPVYGINVAAIISSASYFLWTSAYVFYFRSITGISLGKLLIVRASDFSYIFSVFRAKS